MHFLKVHFLKMQFFCAFLKMQFFCAFFENAVFLCIFENALENQDVDFKNFENNMNAFKDAFGKNYATAAKKYNEAIEEIDKSIAHLNKIKDALTSSSNQLRLANDKAQDLSIRKLTKNAPSVAEKFKGQ